MVLSGWVRGHLVRGPQLQSRCHDTQKAAAFPLRGHRGVRCVPGDLPCHDSWGGRHSPLVRHPSEETAGGQAVQGRSLRGLLLLVFVTGILPLSVLGTVTLVRKGLRCVCVRVRAVLTVPMI